MNWLIGKDPDAGKDWRREEKGKTEDEMVGWHHRLHGYEFEQTLGVDDGQGGLACRSPWGHKELDTTERLNWTEVSLVKLPFSGASGKEPTCQCRKCKRYEFNPWVRKIPWGGHGNPLQYSCLENFMDRRTWQATVHGVTKSQTQLKWLSTHILDRYTETCITMLRAVHISSYLSLKYYFHFTGKKTEA